jgi:hypothetical protein
VNPVSSITVKDNMRALWHLGWQSTGGILFWGALLCGLALWQPASWSAGAPDRDAGQPRQRLYGHCRICRHTIRFTPHDWCAACPRCNHLTNIDQLPE